jgi:hypothetical protein
MEARIRNESRSVQQNDRIPAEKRSRRCNPVLEDRFTRVEVQLAGDEPRQLKCAVHAQVWH